MSEKKVSRRGYAKYAAAGVVVIGVAGAGAYYVSRQPTRPARDYYRIGVVAEMTGYMARGGYIMKTGYDFWAENLNAQGGIEIDGKQYPVELTYYDCRSDSAYAATVAERLATEDIDFALGPYATSTTLGASAVFEKYKMPCLHGSAEDIAIPEQRYQYSFQMLLTTDLTARAPVEMLLKDLALEGKIKTAAVINGDDPFSITLGDGFATGCKEVGVDVIYNETFPEDITDLSATITKIKSLNPDIVLVGGIPSNHTLIVRNMRELDFNPKAFIIHWGIDTEEFISTVGHEADGTIGVTMLSYDAPFNDPLFGSPAHYNQMFIEAYDRSPDYTEAGATACGVFAQEVLKRYKLTPPFDQADKETFKNGCEKETVETLYGPVKFVSSESEDPYQPPYHWHVNVGLKERLIMLQLQNGEIVNVAPPDVANANFVFPKPKWGETV